MTLVHWRRLLVPATAVATLLAAQSAVASTAVVTRDDDDLARAAARRFLRQYVEADGRVARTDQGDDTVGEGQSYALVLALAAGDDKTFDRVWRWTEANLRRDNGLLAHHASSDGTIDDENSATDADLVTAWALLHSDRERHRKAGRALATAVLEHETTEIGGQPVLAAGQWATGEPASLNPSYWALPLLDDLAEATGDSRWEQVADASLEQIDTLTDGGSQLPPDWARADGDRVTPTPAPSGTAPDVRYSLDAMRVVVWCALGDGDATDLAGRWSKLLEGGGRSRALALSPDGTVLDGTDHPLALVAAAAAAFAAGDDGVVERLLDRAASLERRGPTYYGAAWVALGRVLLTTDLLTDLP